MERASPGGKTPPDLLRKLLLCAPELVRWRGTGRGLEAMLEVATGVAGFRVREGTDEGGMPRSFQIVVEAPEAAREQGSLVMRIIEQERPVFVTWSLAWPRQ